MAKRPPRGKCVHCLKEEVERNWDHVFPVAWYPDTTPNDLYKWKIPSCIQCNSEYGEMEEDMLVRLGLCVDPKVAETSGIATKVLRSLSPEAGKNERDQTARRRRAMKLTAQMKQGQEIPTVGVYPGLGERWGRPHGKGIALTVPAESFRKLTEKIVRGIYFLRYEKFIDAPYCIEFYALTDDGAEPINELMANAAAEEYACGPGITVRLARSGEEPMCSIVEISIWGQFKMYASVMPSD